MNVISYTTTNAYWMITQEKLYTQAIIHNLNAFLLLHYWLLGICHCVLDAVSSPREASSTVLIHQQFLLITQMKFALSNYTVVTPGMGKYFLWVM